MAGRDKTYGFNLDDSHALIDQIESRDSTVRQGRPRGSSSGSGIRLARFSLTSGWTSNEATANITDMDGNTIESGATLRDPEAVFASLGNGDTGYCIIQDGKYYAIQAPCPS